MDAIELIQQYGLEYLRRYYSLYRAVVMDNKDPDHLNRLLVRIPAVNPDLEVWALPKNTNGGSVQYGTKGILPSIGEVVWIEFEKGYPLKPVWDYHGWAKGEVPKELEAYDRIGVITPYGNKIYLEDESGTLNLYIRNKINIHIQNSKNNISFEMDNDKIVFNGGENGEVINISSFMSLVQAIIQDLTPLASGANVSKWLSENMESIRDTKLYH